MLNSAVINEHIAITRELQTEHRQQARQRCLYCWQLIAADDDAQKVSKREVAHTECAFAVLH